MPSALQPKRVSDFLENHMNIVGIMLDKDLAKLGDAYVNFAYSLAESCRRGRGSNVRVPAKVLSESLKRAGLRILLPKRTPIHDQADAVEALVVYSWLTEILSLDECVSLLSGVGKDDIELFTEVVGEIVRRLEPSIGKLGKVQGD
jgi:hypothetical protein